MVWQRRSPALLGLGMRWRWVTIGITLVAFALSVFGMGFVQQQFFPSSDRNELIVDFNLPQNSSIAETNAADGPLRAGSAQGQ